jgi:DNA-binding phage protein
MNNKAEGAQLKNFTAGMVNFADHINNVLNDNKAEAKKTTKILLRSGITRKRLFKNWRQSANHKLSRFSKIISDKPLKNSKPVT